MAMRYIFRRPKSNELSEIYRQIPDLDKKLGSAVENAQRSVRFDLSPQRSAQYMFLAHKTEKGWVWVCPSVELVAENEKDLLDLTDQFKVHRPAHLTHLV